ncbi:ADP-ribosylation factor-like protein 6-interacting protein 6 isoform X4 [Nerophis lumbriciformis]|uniref:ADP-ribosylation factor-like protein 6-interacting protein 6 isoform X4 n=1 Tax=Nerophis lumbriciformis TaxID=546530 RepID=UPI002ADF3A7D|nr:ADP-ribosylation factor-like protein 6-interacting protein 6 isoform X8 [Nerophis lumbriciformis]
MPVLCRKTHPCHNMHPLTRERAYVTPVSSSSSCQQDAAQPSITSELQAETVMEEDGTEVRMLGFRSILVLSVLAGIMCCFFSWTLAYLNAYKPGMVPLTGSLLYRDTVDQSLHFDYGVAFLNGAMATLTVIWSLT